jgi:hypothetical protein
MFFDGLKYYFLILNSVFFIIITDYFKKYNDWFLKKP